MLRKNLELSHSALTRLGSTQSFVSWSEKNAITREPTRHQGWRFINRSTKINAAYIREYWISASQRMGSGKGTRRPPMWPGFESWRRRHMWVEFVVGSLPCSERFFSGYSGFSLSLKTNTFKFQFDLERTATFQWVLMNSLVLRG